MNTKATVVVGAVLAVLLVGCGSAENGSGATTSTAEGCTAPPAADAGTPDGWLGYLAAHRDDVSLSVDGANGHRIELNPDQPQPLASAVKVVHLAAYARAVAAGTLDPKEQVTPGDWDRWYLPGTDGGAHEQALQRLGGGPFTLDQLVSAMIQESDNAVPDLLRARLGDQALVDAAAAGGWTDFRPPTLLGSAIAALDPTTTDQWAAARRYSEDSAYRDRVRGLPQPAAEAQRQWAETTFAGSAQQLASIHRRIGTGEFGPGADIARAQLEWQPAPPGTLGLGFKGGSLPGVLTDAMTLRRGDGTVATAVLLNRHMSPDDWAAALQSFAQQPVLLTAMTQPAAADRLACVV